MCIDLHTHSVYSDGTATPAELIRMAVSYGLKGFSLTDHDTTEGVQEAINLGHEQGLKVISGLEIGAMHRGWSLHILGYGFSPDHPDLLNRLERLQQGRRERNSAILEKLAGMGINISDKELTGLSRYGQAGRPHIARILINKGYVKTMNEAFKFYLGRNKPAWQSRFAYTAGESIDIIHQAGGIAVLAHPGQLDTGMKQQPQIIKELVERKLDGLEIFYPSHSRKIKKKLHEIAKQYNLLATGGSDYHGSNRAGGLAGSPDAVCPPDTIMDKLRQQILQRHSSLKQKQET
jgi:predicted metal-dependent phosphoesterase TrpH